MKKLCILCFVLFTFCALFTACKKCEHTYDNACDAICNDCEETREVSAHQWKDATCTTLKTCTVCKATEGEKLPHNWEDATCITAKTCKACGATEGEALGHTPAEDDGDCTTPIICTKCGRNMTAAQEHNFQGEWETDADGHWQVCQNTNCAVAGTKEAHNKGEDGKCTVCGHVFKELHPEGTASLVIPNIFEQANSEDDSIVNEYMYMVAETVEENGTEQIIYKYVPAILTFHVRNDSNKEIILKSIKLRLVDNDGKIYPIASHEVSVKKDEGGNELVYNGTYDEICVTIGKTMEEGESFVAYALALILPDDKAFENKNIEVVIENAEKEFVVYSLNSSVLADINPDNECNWVEGKKYTFRVSTHCYNGCSFDENGKCTVCGSLCNHEVGADDGDCTTAITCSVCGTTTTPAKDSHTGGTATCTEKAVCTVCSTAYGAMDANNHIDENTDHTCDRECGKTDIGAHADSAEDNDHVCDYGCGVILEDHRGGEATCMHGKLCEVCGHEYDTVKDSTNHASDNYTYTDNCDGTHTKTHECGVTLGEPENHTIENHVCTACGAMEIVVSFDAGDYEWKTGDQIKIERIVGYDAEYYTYTASVDENGIITWTPDKKLYWDGEEDHILAAFYPAAGQDDYRSFELPEDQSTLEKLKLADCMNAVWVGNPTTDPINFQMKHRLSMVTVNYAIASEYTNAIVDNVRVIPSDLFAMFDAKDGGKMDEPYGVFGTTIDAYHDAENKTIQAIVIPCTYPEGQVFMKISVNGEELQVKMPEAKTLEEGGEYTFDVKVGQDVIRIEEVSMGDIDSPFGNGWHKDNEIDLRVIGTQAEGKTTWEVGDQIIVTFTSPRFGTQYGTLTYDASDGSWSTDVSFSYLENETPTVSAIYSPCYEVVDGNMQLKDGMQLGMTEYISAACSITDGTINISFEGVTRNYSRLRISTLPDQTLTVTTTGFTPAGATEVATKAYTLTTDENGNIYLYGTFAVGATVSVKQGEVTLADYTFTADKHPEGSKSGINYALDARPIIDGTLGGKNTATEDDINALVEQLKAYVDNGITTITVTGSEPAMYNLLGSDLPAVSAAIFFLGSSGSTTNGDPNSPYCGTIDLILPDVTSLAYMEFFSTYALNSVTLPKVTKLADRAFYDTPYLRTITFGSVLTEVNETGGIMFDRVGEEVGGCDLILNCGQMNESSVPAPDLTNNIWKFKFENEFKSITLTHTGECDECTVTE